MALAPDLPPLRKVSFIAGKKETVASVARRYRVSALQVAQWNQVGPGASFKSGQVLVVYTTPTRAVRSVTPPAAKGRVSAPLATKTAKATTPAKPAKGAKPVRVATTAR
jgi:membrane-bound lytic murein transglycosylase D